MRSTPEPNQPADRPGPAPSVRVGRLLVERPRWMARARCRDVGTAVFFDAAREGEALAWCAGCAVRPACLAHALDADEPDGVWGGVPARRRRAILDGTADECQAPGPSRRLTDDELTDLLAAADPSQPAIDQLRERVPLSRAGGYLYLSRARDLGLVERRGRFLYPVGH